jgi:hypothetical protein
MPNKQRQAGNYEEIQHVRIPITGGTEFRTTAITKDRYMLNGYLDVFKDEVGQQVSTYFTKRPGTSLAYDPFTQGASGGCRGVYYWTQTGGIYIVVGTTIWFYNGSWSNLQTMTTSTGKVGIEQISPSAGTPYLCFNDGVKLYIINGSNTVTTITTNFPTPNNADLIYMDGVLVTSKSNGTFYHCNIEDPTTWDPTKFLTAEMYSDGLTHMCHQNNLLVGFGPWSTEFFYDAGNASGSIFSKVEQSVQMVGCLSSLSIVSQENNITFVGSSRTAGYGVFVISGTSEFKKISTPGIDRFIQNEHTTVGSIYAFGARITGHYFYIITLPTANKTFVYDFVTDEWGVWDWKGSGPFPFAFSTEVASPNYGYWAIQHTNGRVYFLDQETYQDDGVNFMSQYISNRIDLGTTKRKYLSGFELVGDQATSTQNVSVLYTNDDYKTFSDPRTLDMSKVRTFSKRWGNFRRRAWILSYTGNQPWRVQSMELEYSIGPD